MNNATIADNTADADANGGSGGGIFNNASTVNLTNTIVADNRDLSGGAPDCSGVLISGGHNLLGTVTGCTMTNAGSDQIGSPGPIDPLLDLPALNGGPTPTQRLLNGSPAIDAGNPATPGSATPGACEATDQRGVPRNLSGQCSIGSYEPTFCRGRIVNVVGTPGNDRLVGTGGNDGLLGLEGNDRISGLGGNDRLCAGSGNDRLRGGAGNDVLEGRAGTDRCSGGPGTDTAFSCEKKNSVP